MSSLGTNGASFDSSFPLADSPARSNPPSPGSLSVATPTDPKLLYDTIFSIIEDFSIKKADAKRSDDERDEKNANEALAERAQEIVVIRNNSPELNVLNTFFTFFKDVGELPLSEQRKEQRKLAEDLPNVPKIDCVDDNGRTPLILVVISGSLLLVETLLRADANPDFQDEGERTALSWAAEKNHSKIIERLLRAGADPNIRDMQRWTPLFYATLQNNIDSMRHLLRYEANVNARNSAGDTPLLIASTANTCSVRTMQFLTANNADPNIPNANQDYPLMRVIDYLQGNTYAKINLEEVEARMRVLLDAGAKPNVFRSVNVNLLDALFDPDFTVVERGRDLSPYKLNTNIDPWLLARKIHLASILLQYDAKPLIGISLYNFFKSLIKKIPKEMISHLYFCIASSSKFLDIKSEQKDDDGDEDEQFELAESNRSNLIESYCIQAVDGKPPVYAAGFLRAEICARRKSYFETAVYLLQALLGTYTTTEWTKKLAVACRVKLQTLGPITPPSIGAMSPRTQSQYVSGENSLMNEVSKLQIIGHPSVWVALIKLICEIRFATFATLPKSSQSASQTQESGDQKTVTQPAKVIAKNDPDNESESDEEKDEADDLESPPQSEEEKRQFTEANALLGPRNYSGFEGVIHTLFMRMPLGALDSMQLKPEEWGYFTDAIKGIYGLLEMTEEDKDGELIKDKLMHCRRLVLKAAMKSYENIPSEPKDELEAILQAITTLEEPKKLDSQSLEVDEKGDVAKDPKDLLMRSIQVFLEYTTKQEQLALWQQIDRESAFTQQYHSDADRALANQSLDEIPKEDLAQAFFGKLRLLRHEHGNKMLKQSLGELFLKKCQAIDDAFELMISPIENGHGLKEGTVYLKMENGSCIFIMAGMKKCDAFKLEALGAPIPTTLDSLWSRKKQILDLISVKHSEHIGKIRKHAEEQLKEGNYSLDKLKALNQNVPKSPKQWHFKEAQRCVLFFISPAVIDKSGRPISDEEIYDALKDESQAVIQFVSRFVENVDGILQSHKQVVSSKPLPEIAADNLGTLEQLLLGANLPATIINRLLFLLCGTQLQRPTDPQSQQLQQRHIDLLLKLIRSLHARAPLYKRTIKFLGQNHPAVAALTGSVDARGAKLQTPLIHAARNGLSEIAKRLLEEKADPNLYDSVGNAALHHALQIKGNPVLQLLLAAKAEVNVEDRTRNQPLGIPIANQDPVALRRLLESKADCDRPDNLRIPPLILAAYVANRYGCYEPMQILMEYKADPRCQLPDGRTAFSCLFEQVINARTFQYWDKEYNPNHLRAHKDLNALLKLAARLLASGASLPHPEKFRTVVLKWIEERKGGLNIRFPNPDWSLCFALSLQQSPDISEPQSSSFEIIVNFQRAASEYPYVNTILAQLTLDSNSLRSSAQHAVHAVERQADSSSYKTLIKLAYRIKQELDALASSEDSNASAEILRLNEVLPQIHALLVEIPKEFIMSRDSEINTEEWDHVVDILKQEMVRTDQERTDQGMLAKKARIIVMKSYEDTPREEKEDLAEYLFALENLDQTFKCREDDEKGEVPLGNLILRNPLLQPTPQGLYPLLVCLCSGDLNLTRHFRSDETEVVRQFLKRKIPDHAQLMKLPVKDRNNLLRDVIKQIFVANFAVSYLKNYTKFIDKALLDKIFKDILNLSEVPASTISSLRSLWEHLPQSNREKRYAAIVQKHGSLVSIKREIKQDATPQNTNNLVKVDPAAYLLTQLGLDLDILDSDHFSPLMRATQRGDQDSIRHFLKHRATVPFPNPNGDTVLHIAVESQQADCLQLLLDAKADPQLLKRHNKRGRTPLMSAAENGDEKSVNILLKFEESGTSSDYFHSALAHAVLNQRLPCVTSLLAHKGNPKITVEQGDIQRNLLMVAAENGDTETTKALLHSKADVNYVYSNGWSALMYATESGKEAVVQLLLESNAHVDPTNSNNESALAIAIADGHEAAEKMLLEAGADINQANLNDALLAKILNPDPYTEEKILAACKRVALFLSFNYRLPDPKHFIAILDKMTKHISEKNIIWRFCRAEALLQLAQSQVKDKELPKEATEESLITQYKAVSEEKDSPYIAMAERRLAEIDRRSKRDQQACMHYMQSFGRGDVFALAGLLQLLCPATTSTSSTNLAGALWGLITSTTQTQTKDLSQIIEPFLIAQITTITWRDLRRINLEPTQWDRLVLLAAQHCQQSKSSSPGDEKSPMAKANSGSPVQTARPNKALQQKDTLQSLHMLGIYCAYKGHQQSTKPPMPHVRYHAQFFQEKGKEHLLDQIDKNLRDYVRNVMQ